MSTFTITEANRAGLSGLVSSAEAGDEVMLSRHGKPVAAVVTAAELEELRVDRENLRDAALVMSRFAADSGARTDLDRTIEHFGINRSELEAEIDAGLHSS